MIVLSNRAIFGGDTVVYHIHVDIEDDVPMGMLSCTIGKHGAIVAIHLFEKDPMNPINWPKGSHHYMDDIIDCLRFAEPNMKDVNIIDLEIKKCKF